MAGMTVRELAKQIGVSAATVSMALNGRPGVSEETRLRVQEAARQFGYTLERTSSVRMQARPESREGGELLLVIAKTHGQVLHGPPFGYTLLDSVESTAASEGYRITLRYVTLNENTRPGGDNILRELFGHVDGLVLLGTELSDESFDLLPPLPAATVVLDHSCPRQALNSVTADNRGGIAAAMRHLAETGHRRIGYLKNPISIQNFEERYEEYLASLARLGLERGDVISIPEMRPDAPAIGWPGKRTLLSDAYLADNDYVVAAAAKSLQALGVQPGQDVSLVGFDDSPVSERFGFSSVRIENDAMGEAAIHRLMELIRAPKQPPHHIFVSTTLSVRENVGDAHKAQNK